MSPAPPTPDVQVEPLLGRWATTSNLRRGFEETLATLAMLGSAGFVAIGMRRLPVAATHLGWDWSEAQGLLDTGGVALVATVGVGMLGRAWFRFRRRRTDANALARRLDHTHETRDLFTTALAV